MCMPEGVAPPAPWVSFRLFRFVTFRRLIWSDDSCALRPVSEDAADAGQSGNDPSNWTGTEHYPCGTNELADSPVYLSTINIPAIAL